MEMGVVTIQPGAQLAAVRACPCKGNVRKPAFHNQLLAGIVITLSSKRGADGCYTGLELMLLTHVGYLLQYNNLLGRACYSGVATADSGPVATSDSAYRLWEKPAIIN